MLQHGQTLKNVILCEKKKMKDHTLYDFIYMKHPEKVDLQGQKVSQRLFGEEPVRGNC